MPTPVFIDNFNRANATTLGNGWSQTATSNPAISGNRAASAATATGFFWRGLPAGADFDLSMMASSSAGGGSAALYIGTSDFTSTTSGSYYRFGIYGTTMIIGKRAGGSTTTLASAATSGLTTTPAEMRLVIDGSNVTAYVDGVQVLAAVDSSVSRSSLVRISGQLQRAGTGQTTYADDFTVYGPDEPATTFRRRHRLAMSGV